MKGKSYMRAQSRGDSGFARVLTIVALMLIAATGAWAQGTVDSKKGTVDADKWTIKSGETTVEPGVTEVNEGDPVTVTYSGTRHVKSVTAIVTPWLNVNKLSEITDAIAALNMEPGGEYTLTVTFDPANISTEESDDNKFYMSIPDDATLNIVFKNVLPNGTHLTIGDAAYAGMTLEQVDAIFQDQEEPESKNHLNLDFAGGTGSEDEEGSGLYLTLVTPTSSVSTGSSDGMVWFEEVVLYTGDNSFFSKIGSGIKKAACKVGKTVASVATTVGKTVAKAATTVVKKLVNLIVTKIIKPAVEQLVEKIKQNIVKEPLIPTVITASPSNFTFFEGQTQKFDVKVTLGNDGIGGDITFSSSDPSVATVDGNGNVKAISGGKPGKPKYTTITATIGSGSNKATRECKVGVEQTPRPSAISFETATPSVPKGRAIILDPNIVIGNDAVSDGNYRLTFTTNSPGVVAVNDFGYVRGLQMGEATVTAKYGPLSATCTVTVTESVDGMTHVLDNLTTGIVVESGDVLTGTLDGQTQPYKISIADGATITLDNAAIKGWWNENCTWAGLTCEGSATIILKDGTTNIVKGFYTKEPGIFVPSGSTLTIKGEIAGTGTLNVGPFDEDTEYAAAIGGYYQTPCGNIIIEGGTINATGGWYAAAIGGCYAAACGDIIIKGGTVNAKASRDGAGIGAGREGTFGNIIISGGTVNATGGESAAGIGGASLSSSSSKIEITGGTVTATGGGYAAGIGCGNSNTSPNCNINITGGTITATGGEFGAGIGCGMVSTCGNITITTGVTRVTATRIGAYEEGNTCGTVTIGGTVYWDGTSYQNDGENYLKQSPLIYEPGK